MASITTKNLNLYYDKFQALRGINLEIQPNKITALIGPSGCGKLTLLRVFNRMNDLIEGVRIEGKVVIGDEDVYHPKTDLIDLRKKVGMVFQRPNPFPLSVFENVVFERGNKTVCVTLIETVGYNKNIDNIIILC